MTMYRRRLLCLALALCMMITLIPAGFMTSTCLTYICIDKIGLHLPVSTVPYLAVGTFVVSLILFFIWRARKAVK